LERSGQLLTQRRLGALSINTLGEDKKEPDDPEAFECASLVGSVFCDHRTIEFVAYETGHGRNFQVEAVGLGVSAGAITVPGLSAKSMQLYSSPTTQSG
jgi:hypothetical protein